MDDVLEKDTILSEIVNRVPHYIFWKDVNLTFCGCNNMFASQFGYDSPEKVIGKTDYDFDWPKESVEKYRKDDLEIINTGNAKLNYEETQRQPDGSIKTLLVSKVPLYYENKVVGILGIYTDITDRIEQEAQLQKAKIHAELAKQNEEELRKAAMIFAGSVAHDLTTPLTNMNLMANNVSNMLPELLETYQIIDANKQNLNEKQLAYLEKFPKSLQTQLTELNEFIKDSLKALNKTVAGIKTQDDLVKCELWRCMQKVLDEYPYVENEKDLIHWDTSYLFNFMGNPLLFYRILFNLIKNSLYQIREKGRGEIFIRAEQTDTHNVLYFKDTAGGVTQDIVDNIFNSYQTTKAEGTGVGLAFCKLTMQSFGGEMSCRLVDGEFIEFGLKFKRLL